MSKRFYVIIFLGLFGLVSKGYCGEVTEAVYLSSFTASNDNLKEVISTNTFTTITGLYAVVVGSASAAGGITIYDSKGSANNKIGLVDLSSVGYYPYNVRISSGLTYTTTGNVNGITLLFLAYKK